MGDSVLWVAIEDEFVAFVVVEFVEDFAASSAVSEGAGIFGVEYVCWAVFGVAEVSASGVAVAEDSKYYALFGDYTVAVSKFYVGHICSSSVVAVPTTTW